MIPPTHTYILAHDLGTTGNKAALFDEAGRQVGSAFAGYPTAYPHPNWAEQEPDDWWQAVCVTTRQLLAETGVAPSAIAAVGFSGQMMGCVALGADGAPLRSCIIWADQRAQEEGAFLVERCGEDAIYNTCGHLPSPAYSAPKILWLRNHQPEIYAQAVCFLQPKDYIAYRLTGNLVTDYSDASGTLLFNLATRDWEADFLARLDIPVEKLPALHPSNAVVGQVTATAADATGLAPGTPVVIGAGDGSAAGVGAGVIDAGDAYCNIGSSAWVSIAADAPLPDPLHRTITFHHAHPERYAPMGVMQAAGGARQWTWNLLAQDALDLDAAAAAVAPGSDNLLFLPYFIGERSPYWNPLARGALVGLTMNHGKAEIARATLEGVAFNLGLIVNALREQAPAMRAMRFIGGGSRGPLWRQILADIFQMPVQTLALQGDATSWGAAVTAGVGVGLYDWSIATESAAIIAAAEPNPATMARYAELLDLYAATYRALEPIYARLA
ncbi:MAG: xylulokinase [Caldilineaceae bacterium]|nr:xylulokinase [Caldilineaceae bacterium]